MLDRREVNDHLEDLVRAHWVTGLTEMGTLVRRIELIRDLKAFMDDTVEKAMREGQDG